MSEDDPNNVKHFIDIGDTSAVAAAGAAAAANAPLKSKQKMKPMFADATQLNVQKKESMEEWRRRSVFFWQQQHQKHATTSIAEQTRFFFESWEKFAVLEEERKTKNRNRQRENRRRRAFNEMRSSDHKRQKPYLEMIRSKCLFCGMEGGDEFGRGAAMRFKIAFHEYKMECLCDGSTGSQQHKCEKGNLVIPKEEMSTLDAEIRDFDERVHAIMEKVVRLKLDTVFDYISDKDAHKRQKHLVKWYKNLNENATLLRDMKDSLLKYDISGNTLHSTVLPTNDISGNTLHSPTHDKYIQFIRHVFDASGADTETEDIPLPMELEKWTYGRDVDAVYARARDIVNITLREILPQTQRPEVPNGCRFFCTDTGTLHKSPIDFKYLEILKTAIVQETDDDANAAADTTKETNAISVFDLVD